MIEAKAKELSIQKLYEKYPQLNCKIIQIFNILIKTFFLLNKFDFEIKNYLDQQVFACL